MIFERYYDRLQLEHYTIYHSFFMGDAAYEDLTEDDWTMLKHRITMGRFLQYAWSCQMDDTWLVQLTDEEREILVNWDWLAAQGRALIGDKSWCKYLTPGEMAFVLGLAADVISQKTIEGQWAEGK